MKTVILKLGGGVLTNKWQSSPRARTNLIKRIAKELSSTYSKKKPRFGLILLCGAGSFGHHLVYKHKLINRPLTNSSLLKAGKVINQLRELGSLVSAICHNVGLPVIPLQTSSLLQIKNKTFVVKNLSVIETILQYQGIPFLGGDMILGENGKSYVASADDLAVLLAKHFKNSEILFATDVDGVYKSFPPSKGELPLSRIGREELQNLIDSKFSSDFAQKYDVTGRMLGKLKKILQLRKRKVIIFNGQKPFLFKKALAGKKVASTTILL